MNRKIKTIYFVSIISLIIISIGFLFFSSQAEARRGCCSHHNGVCSYRCSDGVNIGYRCCDGSSLSAKCAPYYSRCPSVSKFKPTLPPIKKDYTILTTTSAEVIRTVDGDTIEVKFSDGTIEKVRLIGIDTPETVDPRKPVECFGKEASAKMKKLVNGKTITLKRKPDENRGSYGRLLRYVYVGDFFVNAEMIKQGYAYAYLKYPFDAALMEEFKQYEKEARENELGLWAPGVCGYENISSVLGDSKILTETQKNIENKTAEISKAANNFIDATENTENSSLTILTVFILIGGAGYLIFKNKINL